jgi:hypothetical protein
MGLGSGSLSRSYTLVPTLTSHSYSHPYTELLHIPTRYLEAGATASDLLGGYEPEQRLEIN